MVSVRRVWCVASAVFALLILVSLSVVCSGSVERFGVVGVSSYQGSRLTLAVVEGGICYKTVVWHLFAMDFMRYGLLLDGVEVDSGNVQGFILANYTYVVVGSHRLGVMMGEQILSWNVFIINQTAEKWAVEDHERSVGLKEYTAIDLLMSVLRTHAVTIVFFVISAPFVFDFVKKRKEMEARRVI